jgi:hypothetical protein
MGSEKMHAQFSCANPRKMDRFENLIVDEETIPFTTYYLREAPKVLVFKNCTFCRECIDVFCIYLRRNSDLCHLQHKLIGFIIEMKGVYCAVRTGSLNKAVFASSVKGYAMIEVLFRAIFWIPYCLTSKTTQKKEMLLWM